MKRFLLISIVLLVGCEKGISHRTDFMPSSSGMHRSKLLNVLVMGQSNAEFMNPEGIRAFQDAIGVPTFVVDCAVGGTFIREWSADSPFVRACLSRMPKPDAILWYQGESDAELNGDWTTWAQQFTTLINVLRGRIGTVPIVYARISNDPSLSPPTPAFPIGTFPHWQEVRNQQDSVYLPISHMITTDDIEVRSDYVHFTVAGYQALGVRFASALKLLGV